MDRPPSARPAGGERQRLYREAERLTAEFLVRAPAADGPEIEQFVRQREELLARIQSAPEVAEADAGASAGAIRRMLDLDRELLALLEARKAEVRRQLAEVGRSRQPLASYRGPDLGSPAFLDRLS